MYTRIVLSVIATLCLSLALMSRAQAAPASDAAVVVVADASLDNGIGTSPSVAPVPARAAIPLLGVLVDFLLTKEGMALAASALAWLFHRSVKSKSRQAKLLEYASQAFLVAEAMGVHEKLGGRDKYLRFVETIVTRLKTSGEPELSAKEMQLLSALAAEKAWIAKPAAR